MTEILVAAITGLLAFAGVVVTNSTSGKRIQQSIEKNQAVTDERVKELTREVREHNNFARRMPVVEEQIKVINHRLSDLEQNQENIYTVGRRCRHRAHSRDPRGLQQGGLNLGRRDFCRDCCYRGTHEHTEPG